MRSRATASVTVQTAHMSAQTACLHVLPPLTFHQVGVKVPLIVRLEGTNVEQGKKIISTSGLAITTADDLDDAAKKAVASLKK